jgi:hypothetical protein
MIDVTQLDEEGVGWMPGFLHKLRDLGEHATLMLFLTVVAVGLFEWRVRTENKAFVRLSALGTVAVGLMVAVIFIVGSLVIPTTLAMPAVGKMTRPWAVEQMTTVDNSVSGVEAAAAAKKWDEARDQAAKASTALTRLSVGPALTSLTRSNELRELDDLRAQLATARERFGQTEQAIAARDAGRVETALKEFREAYGPLQSAVQRTKK